MLKDKDHRISYHSQECDSSKMSRGGTLLSYNHLALCSTLPLPDHSYRTSEQTKAYKDACSKQKDSHINYLKHLRKK